MNESIVKPSDRDFFSLTTLHCLSFSHYLQSCFWVSTEYTAFKLLMCKLGYLVQQQVQGAVAHKLCHDAEELRFVADAKDLDDVVESGFVEHLGLLQQTVSLPISQPVDGQRVSESERARENELKINESPKQ